MSTNGAPKIAASQALAALQVSGCDYLKVMSNMDLIKFLDKNAKQGVNVESVQFSDSVLKINKREKQQKRDLIITTANVYNFKEHNYKTCQRAIPITQLKGIVISSQSQEVLLQVRNDYDYRLLIVRQADAIRIICELYEKLAASKLPVELVDDLSKVQVLKADVRKMRASETQNDSSPRSDRLPPPSPGTPLSSPSHTHIRGQSVSNLDGFGNHQIDMKPSMEGWLSKKGQEVTLWRRRYFRLSESNLLYYEARLKGTIELVGGGEVRAWVNKRLSMTTPRGDGAPSAKQSAGGLAPLLYEYKLSAAYNLTPMQHLKDILHDSDRLESFVHWCEGQQTQPQEMNGAANAGAANEAGNPKFYQAVEQFKTIPPSDSAALLAEAKHMYDTYLAKFAPTPINAPTPVKAAIGDFLARQKIASTLAAVPAAAGTTATSPPVPSSATLTNDFFNICQTFVLGHMEAHVLARYLAKSQESEKLLVQDFELKGEMTEADKKQPSCYNCLATFGLMKRRYVCRYCGDVFCSNCLSKSTKLPAEYGIADAIKVCDVCFGSLEISHAHPHAFSYASKGRTRRPINLAASSPQELQQWMVAFRACIANQVSKSTLGGVDSSISTSAHNTCNREGWLMKEDPTTKVWRRRYFILNATTAQLYYYELNLKGSLSLAQGAGVHATTQKATLSAADSQFGGLTSQSSFAYRFNISYNTRLYALSADTEDQMEKWMEALQRAIRRAKPGAGGGLHALMDAGHKNTIVGPSPGVSGATGGIPHTPAAGASSSSSAEQYSSSFQQRAPEGEVTFVFTDVQNSTKLWELAPEAMNKGLTVHDSLLRTLLTLFKGYEVKTEGDAFMVTFFSPLDAVRWCLACQQALLENVWPADLLKQPSGSKEYAPDGITPVFNGIRIRMGIHVGHPACRRNPITGRMDYFGPVVNRSARVSDSAHGGQVVCTAEVYERIQAGIAANEFPHTKLTLTDLGEYRYKGITEIVQVWQINNEALAGRNPFPKLRTTKADEPPPEGENEEEDEKQQPTAATTTVAPQPKVLSTSDSDSSAGDYQQPMQITISTPHASDPKASLTSPSRPSHLTINSISTGLIHPFTPTALGRQQQDESAPAHIGSLDSDDCHSDQASSEDEEAEEDERERRETERNAKQAGMSGGGAVTPDASAGFMSPSADVRSSTPSFPSASPCGSPPPIATRPSAASGALFAPPSGRPVPSPSTAATSADSAQQSRPPAESIAPPPPPISSRPSVAAMLAAAQNQNKK